MDLTSVEGQAEPAASPAPGTLAAASGDDGMSIIGDKYAVYVLAAYGSTALILGWLLWTTLSANAKARQDLAQMEKERGR